MFCGTHLNCYHTLCQTPPILLNWLLNYKDFDAFFFVLFFVLETHVNWKKIRIYKRRKVNSFLFFQYFQGNSSYTPMLDARRPLHNNNVNSICYKFQSNWLTLTCDNFGGGGFYYYVFFKLYFEISLLKWCVKV